MQGDGGGGPRDPAIILATVGPVHTDCLTIGIANPKPLQKEFLETETLSLPCLPCALWLWLDQWTLLLWLWVGRRPPLLTFSWRMRQSGVIPVTFQSMERKVRHSGWFAHGFNLMAVLSFSGWGHCCFWDTILYSVPSCNQERNHPAWDLKLRYSVAKCCHYTLRTTACKATLCCLKNKPASSKETGNTPLTTSTSVNRFVPQPTGTHNAQPEFKYRIWRIP